jgi:hypothetical protein
MLAARNPSANRSLIAFAAWSCFAHAAVMAVTAFSKGGYRGDLWGVVVLVIIGVALIVLAPAKQAGDRVSAAVRARHPSLEALVAAFGRLGKSLG